MSGSTVKSTALVLAGGGSFGAVQVGMLRALIAYGIVPDLVVGSSVGAINGAYFAGAPNAEGVDRLAAIWRGLRRSEVFPFSWRSLFGLLGRRGSVVDPGGLRGLIEQRLPYRNLEQAAVPLHVVATDLLGGGAVRLSSGPAVEAVLASCAIPGAFPPVRIGERHLIDGAVASNTPISVAIELGAKRVIVLPTGYACSLATPPRGAIASALHAITLLISHQLLVELERCRGMAEIITVPPLCPLAVSPYDFSRAGELIDRAAAQTDRWLDRGALTRERVPPALRAHTHAQSDRSKSQTACELESDEPNATPARAVIQAGTGNAAEVLGRRLAELRASGSRGRVSAGAVDAKSAPCPPLITH